MIYEDRKPEKNWKTRRRYCLNKNDDGRTTILHPYRDCEYNIRRSGIEVVRHRVCTHCCADFHNSRLVGEWVDLESWRIYLQNIIISRHYDYAAIWNKDHMAAMNMRIILEHWGETMSRPEWNLPYHDNVGYLAALTHLRVILNEVGYFCFMLLLILTIILTYVLFSLSC